MLRFVADENFNGRILRALQRRLPELDVVRAQDVLPQGTSDPDLLSWAAEEGRVLLSHDIATVIGYAYERVSRGEPMPGVIVARLDLGIGPAVEDLQILALATEPDEIRDQIWYLPL